MTSADFPRELEMRHLVFADRHEPRVVNRDVAVWSSG
jgi:hypothetical protein